MSTHESGTEKTVAVCPECGEMYVAHAQPNGTIRPLGVTECSCGETDLQPIR
ncbi:hypothetical protein [Natrarchaeobaculum aegyptiacum]|uniref:hypothetical protein n=1 Tax=Natrarchaeobaculum aegyptiacum TaxID=745377 RepID=UPI001642ACE4|nr:hypothetical protein [Natrarchaeobaculum aegyptiacum]